MKRFFLQSVLVGIIVVWWIMPNLTARSIALAEPESVIISPSIATTTLKNGESLTLAVVVTATVDITSMTAAISKMTGTSFAEGESTVPLAVISLTPQQAIQHCPNSSGAGWNSQWKATWFAQGLEEAEYQITVTAITETGNVYCDKRLRFSDPVFGKSTIGSAEFPNGGMTQSNELILSDNTLPSCALLTQSDAYAYYGVGSAPGRVAKIDLETMSVIDQEYCNLGENGIRCGVISGDGEYAYFGTNTIPGAIIKLRLADLTRVGVLVVDEGIGNFSSAFTDAAGCYGYFVTETMPTSIVQIDLLTFSERARLTLEPEEGMSRCSLVDGGQAYIAVQETTAALVQVDLATLTRQTTLTLPESDHNLAAAVLDASSHIGYFGTGTSPSRVIKVHLPTLTRLGSLELPAGYDNVTTAAFDHLRQFIYWGFNTIPGRLCSVDVASFSLNQTLILDGDYALTLVLSLAGNNGYITTLQDNPFISRIDLADFSIVESLPFCSRINNLRGAALDPENTYGYFTAYSEPAKLLKIDLANWLLMETLDLVDGNYTAVPLMDPAGMFLCVGIRTVPGAIVKVELATFTETDRLILPSGLDDIISGVIDETGSFAYFGLNTSPGKVVKINLASFTQAGVLTLEPGEDQVKSAIISADGQYGYFGTDTNPGKIIKVDLQTMQRLDVLTLLPSEGLIRCSAMNPVISRAYFACSTGKIVVLEPDSFTKIEVIDPGPVSPSCLVIDPTGTVAYLGTQASDSAPLLKLDLTLASVDSELPLDYACTGLVSAILTADGRMLYGGTASGPCRIIGIRLLDRQDMIRGIQASVSEPAWCDNVRWYSHEQQGDVRLAIYCQPLGGDLPSLVWQSAAFPLTTPESWITVPISAGYPNPLVLAPGNYWLCWQTSAESQVGSYELGAMGDGITWPSAYGFFPALCRQERYTAEQWSIYVSYSAVTFTPTPPSTSTPTVTLTPTATAIVSQTPTRTPSPSASPTLEATVTPTPTFTTTPSASLPPTLEPTATIVPQLDCYLYCNGTYFFPDDRFLLVYYQANDYYELTAMVFIALDVYGEYWFYPSWGKYEAPDYRVDFAPTALDLGDNVQVILDFQWPDTREDSMSGVRFWGVVTTQDLTLLCDASTVEFGFGPRPTLTPTMTPTQREAQTPSPTPSPQPSATVSPSATPWMSWDGATQMRYGSIVPGKCSKQDASRVGTVRNVGGARLEVRLILEGPHQDSFGFSVDHLGQSMTMVLEPQGSWEVFVYFCPQSLDTKLCDLRIDPATEQEDIVISLAGMGGVWAFGPYE